MYWFRVALVVGLCLLGVAMTLGALQDGERGLNTLPWLLAALAAIVFMVFPRRRSG